MLLGALLLATWSVEVVPSVTAGASPFSFSGPHPARAPIRPVPRTGETMLPEIGVRSLRWRDLEPISRGPPPVRIEIPAIGVDSRIVPVGIQRGGAMQIPEDAGLVGWYRFGPAPGDAGSTVLAGHVDSSERAGVFFRLQELRPGAVVRVRGSDGRWEAFEVVWRTMIRKERLPGSIFARKGRSVLSLITCGGPFDAAEGHYTHNVIVAAVPRR